MGGDGSTLRRPPGEGWLEEIEVVGSVLAICPFRAAVSPRDGVVVLRRGGTDGRDADLVRRPRFGRIAEDLERVRGPLPRRWGRGPLRGDTVVPDLRVSVNTRPARS